jgi:hypothetical protein
MMVVVAPTNGFGSLPDVRWTLQTKPDKPMLDDELGVIAGCCVIAGDGPADWF